MNERLGRFVLASLLLHAALLILPLRNRPAAMRATDPLGLQVRIAKTPVAPARSPAPRERVPASAIGARAAPSAPAPSAAADGVADGAQANQIDLDGARLIARRFATQPGAWLGRGEGAAASPEAALTRALRAEAIVERREVDGWVVRIGRRRCLIAPADVPHFMRGVAVVPLCEMATR